MNSCVEGSNPSFSVETLARHRVAGRSQHHGRVRGRRQRFSRHREQALAAHGCDRADDSGRRRPQRGVFERQRLRNCRCNTYRASYTLDGDSLEISEPAGTLIGCPPPVDEFERAYLDALGQVATWELDGEELVLSDADGGELLRFEVASIAGSWTVTGVNTGDAIVSPIVGTELTAVFAEDGSLTGSAGCNTYTTTYTADAGDIEIEPAASTKKFCPEPEGVMEQETAYPRGARCSRDLRLQRASDGLCPTAKGRRSSRSPARSLEEG